MRPIFSASDGHPALGTGRLERVARPIAQNAARRTPKIGHVSYPATVQLTVPRYQPAARVVNKTRAAALVIARGPRLSAAPGDRAKRKRRGRAIVGAGMAVSVTVVTDGSPASVRRGGIFTDKLRSYRPAPASARNGREEFCTSEHPPILAAPDTMDYGLLIGPSRSR